MSDDYSDLSFDDLKSLSSDPNAYAGDTAPADNAAPDEAPQDPHIAGAIAAQAKFAQSQVAKGAWTQQKAEDYLKEQAGYLQVAATGKVTNSFKPPDDDEDGRNSPETSKIESMDWDSFKKTATKAVPQNFSWADLQAQNANPPQPSDLNTLYGNQPLTNWNTQQVYNSPTISHAQIAEQPFTGEPEKTQAQKYADMLGDSPLGIAAKILTNPNTGAYTQGIGEVMRGQARQAVAGLAQEAGELGPAAWQQAINQPIAAAQQLVGMQPTVTPGPADLSSPQPNFAEEGEPQPPPAPPENELARIGRQQFAKGQREEEIGRGPLIQSPDENAPGYYGQEALIGAPPLAAALATGPLGAAATFGLSSAGRKYGEARQEGESKATAGEASGLEGIASALTADISFGHALNPATMSALLRVTESTGSMAAASVADEASNILTEKFVEGKDLSEDEIYARLKSAAKGSVIPGMLMGGAGAAMHPQDAAAAAMSRFQRLTTQYLGNREQAAPEPGAVDFSKNFDAQGQPIPPEAPNAQAVRSDQGLVPEAVREAGNVPGQGAQEGGEAGRDDLQRAPTGGGEAGDGQEGLNDWESFRPQPFYSRDETEAPAATSPDEAHAANTAAFGARGWARMQANGIDLESRNDLNPEDHPGLSDEQREGIHAYTQDGRAHILFDNTPLPDLPTATAHEVMHLNKANVFRSEDEMNRVSQALVDDAERDPALQDRLDKIPASTPDNQLAEEVVARGIGEAWHNSNIQRLLDNFKITLNRAGIPKKWIDANPSIIREMAVANVRSFIEQEPGGRSYQMPATPGAQDSPDRKPRIRLTPDVLAQQAAAREQGDTIYSREENPPFFSAMSRALDNAAATGAPKQGGEALKKWLDGVQGKGGFRGNERQWLGVDQWLDAHPNATRDELRDFVRGNQVRVTPVKLGEKVQEAPDIAAARERFQQLADRHGSDLTDAEVKEMNQLVDKLEAAGPNPYLRSNVDERTGRLATKFASYVLPGGENYREHLLTLPETGDAKATEFARKLAEAKDHQRRAEERFGRNSEQYRSESGLVSVLEDRAKEAKATTNFRSSHFDEPNILAHVRMNDRTTADGAKALHIEEIQSDWHQKGRKEGYANRPQEIKDQLAAMQRQIEKAEEAGASVEELNAISKRMVELEDRYPKAGVPNAPLKNTEDWAMLGFKHALREAVESGKDKVTWTTGEQQAERYDLSKHLESVTAGKYGNGEWRVRAVTHDGKTAFDERGIDSKKLPDIVGKELADKIIKDDGGHYEGLDLKVGGEGMRGFYDKILPKAVEKYVKQWGGKVGSSDIRTYEAPGLPNQNEHAKVHSVDITPAMRESVARGQPFYSRDEVSTRFPTAVKATENPLRERLHVGLEAARKDPKALEHNMGLMRENPEFGPKASHEDIINHMARNLTWLHDQMPKDIRDRARQWYDGANRIAQRLASKYGMERRAVSGVMAALSPQKDWFMNASLGKRVLDTMHNHANDRWSPEMDATAQRIFGGEQYASRLKDIRGKTLSEVPTPGLKAMWVRAYDEAHNPRDYHVIHPEGDEGDFAKNQDGARSRVAWGSLDPIGKAVSIFDNPSLDNVSRMLGDQHKVRSFYNNIESPNSPAGHTTIDTHAVAAAHLRPLSGSTTEVLRNFGGVGTKDSTISGNKGTYGIYHEAYRRAAELRNILPREMQSITWEGVRGLFPDTMKRNPAIVAEAHQTWDNFRKGRITENEAREHILQLAGGIREQTGYPILDDMIARKEPLTREQYLSLNFPDGVPNLTPEQESELPPQFRSTQDEAQEEANGYYQSHQGKIKGLVALANRMGRSKGSPEGSPDTSQAPTPELPQ